MARCEDCLHFEVCQALEQGNGIMRVHPLYCGFYKPTADVVPRAELAREILEEMEKELAECDCVDRVFDTFVNLTIAELKKKYTEENHETRN